MGGGTSNAVCLIKYFTRNKVNKNLLSILGKNIGSDLKLFFHEQGFLKNLKTINDFRRKYSLYFLLVYPNVKCSTQYVYSKVKKFSSKSKYSFNKINDKRKFIDLLINENNDLQSIVEKKYPLIKKLLIAIRNEKGCCFSRMTGSGSVCYGLFKDQITAKKDLNKLKIKLTKFWISFVKTV